MHVHCENTQVLREAITEDDDQQLLLATYCIVNAINI